MSWESAEETWLPKNLLDFIANAIWGIILVALIIYNIKNIVINQKYWLTIVSVHNCGIFLCFGWFETH
jgi:hypothetical protein